MKLINTLELEQIKYDLKFDVNTIDGCLRLMDQIALRPDALTALQNLSG